MSARNLTKRRVRALRVAAFVGGLVAVSSAACTAILDRDNTQCGNDGDCVHFASNAVCRDQVCVEGPISSIGSSDAGPDSTTGTTNGPDGAIDGSNAGDDAETTLDAAFGVDGCFSGTPTTNAELLNACTHAACLPFDNCATLGLCGADAGYLPAEPKEGGVAATTTSDAGATQICTSIAAHAPIYVTGSSNFPEFLKPLATVLAAPTNATQYTIVWQVSNSCKGVDAMYNSTGVAHLTDGPTKTTVIYNDDGTTTPCLIGTTTAANGPPVDVGESDIFASSCATTLGYTPTNSGVGEYIGPIQAMTFVVPGGSSQRVISAEAANAVFGAGGTPVATTGASLPWTNFNQFFTRSSSTGTNQLLSRAMNVDPGSWWGFDKGSAANMDLALNEAPSTAVESTIGVLATDVADSDRGNIRVLAFQSHDQSCGFWPDETADAHDKNNVRDGHYPVWGPLHFFTPISGGAPTSAGAGAFVTRFSQPRTDQNLLEAIIASNNIPQCAMHVTRTTEMGDLASYTPPISCSCFFDKTATGTTSCTACMSNTDCPASAPACNYGYCEVQ